MPIQISYVQLGLFYTISLIPILNFSRNHSTLNAVLSLFGFIALLLIWKKQSDTHKLESRSELGQFLILTFVALSIPVYFSETIIQALWDSFLSSNGANPYIFKPTDSQIGVGQTTLLFSLLSDKQHLSSISPAIQILIKPIYLLFRQTNLFITLTSVKLLLSAALYVVALKLKFVESPIKWLMLPALWIFGISQANPELLGLLLFLWGFFYFKDEEYPTAAEIWGVSSLFGLPFFIAAIFYLIQKKESKQIVTTLVSLAVWLFLVWDFKGLTNWALISSWHLSIIQHLSPLPTSNYVSSAVSISITSITLILTYFRWNRNFNLVAICCFALLFPFNTATLWGLSIFLISSHEENNNFASLVFSLYTLALFVTKLQLY
ncbi:hypothetical protein EP331_15770 [bacterium]|nr:MAG: hypothetical protein EP331_15770 [bacterium]